MHGGGLVEIQDTLYSRNPPQKVEIPHGIRGTPHKAGDHGDLHFTDVCPEFTVPSNNDSSLPLPDISAVQMDFCREGELQTLAKWFGAVIQ